MMDKSEGEIQSVFDHWCERNQEHPAYEHIKAGVRDRGISVKRIASKMDWGHFAPLSREECFMAPTQENEAWDEASDKE